MTRASVAVIKKGCAIMKRILCLLLLLLPQQISCSDALHPDVITLPENFRIEIYAYNVESVRALTLAQDGTLFAGSKNGSVYAITKDKEIRLIDKGLTLPIGIDFYDNDLYVSDLSRIRKYTNILKNLNKPPAAVIVTDTLPDRRHHGGKFIKIGPDGKLYVNIGAPCNVCLEEDERFATISRMDVNGKNFEIYAQGVRNSVGFDWHPETKELWFTDNGRDWLGDNRPPDELNRAVRKGQHFGFPFLHGKQVRDPDFWKERPDIRFVPPVYELPAHVAPLGMRFYTGDMFPDYYKNGIFIAEHGSWNRSRKTGYRVTFVKIKENRAVSYEVFASGWLTNENAWGRPVDVEIAPDGALFVSDDKAGVIYRIYYEKESP
jgi:glucose/arabinose dehydrogenase